MFGVDKYPLRHSFYTWAEGAVPIAVFQFLTDATEHQDQHEMVALYLNEIGVQEYFVHQPEMEKIPVFRGWRRSPSKSIVEIKQDTSGGLFSETLNLLFRWENQYNTHVRLLRSYLPDGTPIATSMEYHYLSIGAEKFTAEKERVGIETQSLQELEAEIEQLRSQLEKHK